MTELTVKEFIDWYFDDLGPHNMFTMFKQALIKNKKYSISVEELVKHTNDLNLYNGGKVKLV